MRFYCDTKRHLICIPYSKFNLHYMADLLNIKRCWYHGGKFPHYDIPKKRAMEIGTKCTVVTPKELLKLIKGQ